MIQIKVPDTEFFDERTEEFVSVAGRTLQLEHSLISISKWESKWKKPFLGKENWTGEEILDYIRCMTITQNVDPMLYRAIPSNEVARVREYINDSMTATWFNERNKKPPQKKVITSELIYYWMVSQNIPFECEKWHFNRLMTLIRICGEKSSKPEKMSKKDRQALMAQRRASHRRPR